jgi:ketosteroid isomerase-like protein
VSAVLEAFMTLDCDKVLALSTSDVTFEFPFISDMPITAEEFRCRVQRTITLMTGLRFTDLEVSALGDDTVLARYAASARISLTARPYAQRYLSVFEFEGGRMAYFQENFDTSAFKAAFDLPPTWRMR